MQETEKLSLFGYTRESIDLVSGIAIQKEAIERYCTANAISLSKIYTDNNKSAFRERPKFELMWRHLDEVDGIIVANLTRFGRSLPEILLKLEELQEKGKRLILVKEGLDSSKPESKLMLRLWGVIAEYERDLIRERTTAGRKWAMVHGTKSGKPMHRPRLEIDQKKLDDLRAKGLSWVDCARMLGVSASWMYQKGKTLRS